MCKKIAMSIDSVVELLLDRVISLESEIVRGKNTAQILESRINSLEERITRPITFQP